MAAKGVVTLVWNLFEQSGSLQYYLMFRAMDKDFGKSEQERRREEIERLTR